MRAVGIAVRSSTGVAAFRGPASEALRWLAAGSLQAGGSGASVFGRRSRAAGTLTAAISFGAVVVAALVIPVVASAAPKVMGGFIGGSNEADVNGFGGGFNQPRDSVVYEGTDGDSATDLIFTVESQGANMRVQRLDHDGTFQRQWGRNVDAAGGTGAGEVCSVALACQAGGAGTGPGEFDHPTGVAVDQANGWIYVYDRGNKRVQKFDLDGNFLLMFGDNVNATDATDVCTATDITAGDVCGVGTGGTAVGQIGPAGSGSLLVRGVAVDPTTSDVLVADPSNRRIQRFNSDGTLDASPVIGSATNFGPDQPLHIAVDSRGVVYASDSNDSGQIDRYDALDANGGGAGFLPPITGATLGGAGTTEGLEVDVDADGGGVDDDTLYVTRNPSATAPPLNGNTSVLQFGPVATPSLTVAPTTADEVHGGGALGTRSTIGLGVAGDVGRIYVGVSLSTVTFQSCTSDFQSNGCAGLVVLSDPPGSVSATVSPPADVGSDSAQLAGSIDPEGGTVSYRFEVSSTGAANDWEPVGGERTYLSGDGPRDVFANAIGLDPNSFYRVRIIVDRYAGFALGSREQVVSSESNFVTDSAPPEVVTLPVGPRTTTTAELRATVDASGAATSYRFEYGPAGGSFDKRVPVPDAAAGSGNRPEDVSQIIAGLLPGTAYHFRVVAVNSAGSDTGDAIEFATKPISSVLPGDRSRGYELVSPADKIGGAGVGVWGTALGGAIRSVGFGAYRGERFAAMGEFGAMLLDGAAAYGSDWAFSERVGDAVGWRSHSPLTHASSETSQSRTLFVASASDDLSTFAWHSNGGLLRPFAQMETWQAADIAVLSDWEGRWEPTVTDPVQDLGEEGLHNSDYTVISADGSHALLSGWYRGLAGPDDPSSTVQVDGRATYLIDLSAGLSDDFDSPGPRSNVGVCTVGTTIPERTASGKLDEQDCAAAGDLISPLGATINTGRLNVGAQEESFVNAISSDGSRAFFMSPDPFRTGALPTCAAATGVSTSCPPQLYVRQRNEDGSVVTRWISKAEPGLLGIQDASLTGAARFEGASADGSVVYFRTNSPLTADDPNGSGAAPVTTGTASNNSWDLYRYELAPGDDPTGPGAKLTRVSAGPSGDSDCNAPLGGQGSVSALRFVSDDGGRAYFTCAAPLSDVPASQNATITAPGGTATTGDWANLYLYDESTSVAQRWRFVARIPRSTTPAIATCASTGSYRIGPIGGNNGAFPVGTGFTDDVTEDSNCVRGTADGAFVTFWTDGRLTADDPDSITGDVYAYDAEVEELTRITAPQGGLGGTYPCRTHDTDGQLLLSPEQCYGDGGFDTSTAMGLAAKPILGLVTDPEVPGDRIAFFQSRSRLVPEDTDAAYDVYQWRNGDLGLISTGASDTLDAFFKGNSADGQNVYFATRDRLTWQDRDAVLDVYTARVDGGIDEPPMPPVCDVLAGACQGAVTGKPVSVDALTDTHGGGGNASPGARKTLRVGKPSMKARRRAVRTGSLLVAVRASKAGRVSAVAKGRIGKRIRRVARSSVELRRAGQATLRLRLNRAARQRLKSGRDLKLTIQVRSPGARSRSITARLPGGRREA